MPGAYKAVVAKRVDGVVTPIGPPQEFQVVVEGQENMSVSDRTALVEFQQKAIRLQRAVSGATQAANALRPRLTAIKRAITETPSAPPRLYEDAMALEKRTNEIVRALSGDNAARQRNMNTPPSINDRVGYVVGAQRMTGDSRNWRPGERLSSTSSRLTVAVTSHARSILASVRAVASAPGSYPRCDASRCA